MPIRLPDSNVLGRPNFGGARPRASIDGSAIGEGMERAGRTIGEAGQVTARATEQVGTALGRAVTTSGAAMGRAVEQAGNEWSQAYSTVGKMEGKALQDLGEGIGKVAKTVEEMQEERAKLDFYRAKADFIQRRAATDTVFDKDVDYTTMPARYRETLVNHAEVSGTLIGNPRYREMFGYQVQADIASAGRNADRQAFKLEAKDRLVELGTRLDGLRDSALVTKEEDRGATISVANGYIDQAAAAGYIDPADTKTMKKKWAVKYAETSMLRLPAQDRVKLLSRGPQNEDEFLDRVTGVESGGKATAKNPNSSATGPNQFIDQTWLGTLKKHGPTEIGGQIQEDAKGRFFVADKAAETQILALRADPKLSREMTRALSRENGQALSSAGIKATADNLYLAHFLGAGDAIKVLKADSNTPVAELLRPEVVSANTRVLSGKTAGTVVQWAGQKMGVSGPSGSFADFLPEPRRAQLLQGARQEVEQIATVQSSQRSEQFTRAIVDAEAGISALPDRALIQNDPLLSEKGRNTLLKSYDSAAGDVVKFQRALGRFHDPNGGTFNPFDKDDEKAVDKIYKGLGGGMPALQRVVERTGIVPSSVATSIRADAASNDPKRVANAATLARNLMTQNPTVFTSVPGSSDIETTAVTFGHYVDSFGMSAEQAAKRIVEMNSPEYQAKVKARIKTEDVDKKMKDGLTIGNVEGAFDQSWGGVLRNPSVGFSPEARGKMYQNFATLTKERYLEHGDFDLAKTQAANQLKKVWGVSNINGSAGLTGGGVVMPYPPERAPRMAGIENASDLIAEHAIESIRGETGQDVDRSKLRLDVIVGVTPSAFKSGQPVPYALSWEDKNGNLQMLHPTRAFFVDPDAIRETQTRKRQAEFEAGRTQADTRAATVTGQTPEQRSAITTREERKAFGRQRLIDEGMILPGTQR